MSEDQYTVRCEWDLDARVWVATSDDVPGLATGADTLDELFEKLIVVIPELLEANGLLKPDQQGDIPFAISAERHEKAPRAARWRRTSLRPSRKLLREAGCRRASGQR